MLIRCKLHRDGGTKVHFSKDGPFNKGRQAKDYHFKANQDGHHVCDVTDKEHFNRLVSISDAYEVYDPEFERKETEALAAAALETPPAAKPEGGEGAPITTPPGGEGTGEGDKIPSNPQTIAIDYAQFSHQELLAMVEEATGSKPKGNTSKEKLIEALKELDALKPDAPQSEAA